MAWIGCGSTCLVDGANLQRIDGCVPSPREGLNQTFPIGVMSHVILAPKAYVRSNCHLTRLGITCQHELACYKYQPVAYCGHLPPFTYLIQCGPCVEGVQNSDVTSKSLAEGSAWHKSGNYIASSRLGQRSSRELMREQVLIEHTRPSQRMSQGE
jgi:hypothetical protein